LIKLNKEEKIRKSSENCLFVKERKKKESLFINASFPLFIFLFMFLFLL